jgi:two-component system invasion response regulator UvrY
MARNILLADDHVIIRRGLRTLIDNNFGRSQWTEVDRTDDVLNELKKKSYTHAVLDMQLLDTNLLEVLPDIRKANPDLPLMIYTMCSEDLYAPRMLKLGVQAFLSKQLSEESVINAFGRFFQNKCYFSEHILYDAYADKMKSVNPIDELSEREFAVLQYLVKGVSVKEICGILDLKTTTVATYKARIFEKTGAASVVDLVRLMDLYSNEK